MPSTPKDHWQYTIDEWTKGGFSSMLALLPDKLNVIYDIGANVGGFTHVLHETHPHSKYYCFEPVERNYSALIENVPYATCFKKGIYYGETASKVMWRGENIGAFFVEHIRAGEPMIYANEMMELVELEALDIPKPDLVKIDIEGAEENVLQRSTVLKQTPYIIIEWHPDHVEPVKFFQEYLPQHQILAALDHKQFLLAYKPSK